MINKDSYILLRAGGTRVRGPTARERQALAAGKTLLRRPGHQAGSPVELVHWAAGYAVICWRGEMEYVNEPFQNVWRGSIWYLVRGTLRTDTLTVHEVLEEVEPGKEWRACKRSMISRARPPKRRPTP